MEEEIALVGPLLKYDFSLCTGRNKGVKTSIHPGIKSSTTAAAFGRRGRQRQRRRKQKGRGRSDSSQVEERTYKTSTACRGRSKQEALASRKRSISRYSKQIACQEWLPLIQATPIDYDFLWAWEIYEDDEIWADERFELVKDAEYTLLHAACQERSPLTVIQGLIADEAKSLLTRDENGQTPLHLAVCRRHLWDNLDDEQPVKIDVVRSLLSACPEACLVQDVYGQTPLHTALINSNRRWGDPASLLQPAVEAFHAILSACPATASWQVKGDSTLLHLILGPDRFCFEERVLTTMCLSILRIQPTLAKTQNNHGSTPLHLAIKGLHFQVAMDMLRLCPETASIKDYQRSWPLKLALSVAKNTWSQENAAALFLSLISALVRSHPEAARDLLQAQPKWAVALLHTDAPTRNLVGCFCDEASLLSKPVDETGMTLLHWALAKKQSPPILRYLIKSNPRTVTMVDLQGNTPLHQAFISGSSLETQRRLVESGEAALAMVNAAGITPLQLATVNELFALFRSVPWLLRDQETKGHSRNQPLI